MSHAIQRCHSSGPFSSHDFSGHVIRSQLHPMGGVESPNTSLRNLLKKLTVAGDPCNHSTQHPRNRDRILGLMAAGATY